MIRQGRRFRRSMTHAVPLPAQAHAARARALLAAREIVLLFGFAGGSVEHEMRSGFPCGLPS
jgi:hypothetical protein